MNGLWLRLTGQIRRAEIRETFKYFEYIYLETLFVCYSVEVRFVSFLSGLRIISGPLSRVGWFSNNPIENYRRFGAQLNITGYREKWDNLI